ncbi:MAG: HAD family hydrolase [Acidobacteriota bacterium]
MPKALLFDLDGTLIVNSMDTFLPPYFTALTRKLADVVPPGKLIDQLQASTRVMMANDDPGRTNAQVFAADFFPKIGVPSERLLPLFEDFYAREYCDLRVFTKPVEGAREVLTGAFARHHPVVIATAPLFPLNALQQRLSWAEVADFPYAFITDYESMHASKPNPAYYREIAERLNRPAQECVMVGNEVQMDILPARRAGMKTFWITDAGSMATDVPADWRGTLADLGALVESGELDE